MKIEIYGDVIINNSSGGANEYSHPEGLTYVASLDHEDYMELLDELEDEIQYMQESRSVHYDDIEQEVKKSMAELQKKKQQIVGDYSKTVLNYATDIDSIEAILTDFLDDYMDCF